MDFHVVASMVTVMVAALVDLSVSQMGWRRVEYSGARMERFLAAVWASPRVRPLAAY